MKNIRILTVLVLLCIVSNFVISFAAVSRVRRSSRDYVVTEAAFVRSVYDATTNFLASIQSPENQNTDEESNEVTVRFVEDMCIYYRPRLGRWVVRYNGCDFYQGDYLDDGVLLRVLEGRAYCKGPNGIVILRPKPRAHESAPVVGLGARVSGDEPAAL